MQRKCRKHKETTKTPTSKTQQASNWTPIVNKHLNTQTTNNKQQNNKQTQTNKHKHTHQTSIPMKTKSQYDKALNGQNSTSVGVQ